MRHWISTRLSAALCICLLLTPVVFADEALPAPDPAAARETDLGRYRIAYASALQPLAINRMHSWVIHVADADGEPVEDAELVITGGMPAHDHGLPSEPRVTRNLGDGKYLVEGMKFHMGGAWEVVVTATAADGVDSVTLDLEL